MQVNSAVGIVLMTTYYSLITSFLPLLVWEQFDYTDESFDWITYFWTACGGYLFCIICWSSGHDVTSVNASARLYFLEVVEIIALMFWKYVLRTAALSTMRRFSVVYRFPVMTSNNSFESVTVNRGTSLLRIRCRSCWKKNALSKTSAEAIIMAAGLNCFTRRDSWDENWGMLPYLLLFIKTIIYSSWLLWSTAEFCDATEYI